jgi:hypothetical protein
VKLRRTLLSGLGGGALVVWIAAAATTGSRPVGHVPPTTNRAVEVSGAQLAHETSRLHERLRPSSVPLQSRDLFAYASHVVAPSHVARKVPAAAPVSAASVAPPLKLVGIAEDGPADAVVRTAVLSGLGDLFLVKEGESVGARYQVSVISANSVELVDSSDHSSFRLTLP